MPVKEKFKNGDQLSPESQAVTAYAGLDLLSRQERQDRITRSAQAARICAESEWGGEGVDHQHTASFFEGLGDSTVQPEIKDGLNSSKYLQDTYDRKTRAYLLGQVVRASLLTSSLAKPGIVGTEGMRTEIVVTNPSRVDATEGDKVISGKIRTFAAEIYNPEVENIREIVASGIEDGKIDSVKLYPHLDEADRAVGKIIRQREQMSQESGRGIAHFTKGELATFPAMSAARVAAEAALIFSAVSCQVAEIEQVEATVESEIQRWKGREAGHVLQYTYPDGSVEFKKVNFTISDEFQFLSASEDSNERLVLGRGERQFVIANSTSSYESELGTTIKKDEFIIAQTDGKASWRMDDTTIQIENDGINIGLINPEGNITANVTISTGSRSPALETIQIVEKDKNNNTVVKEFDLSIPNDKPNVPMGILLRSLLRIGAEEAFAAEPLSTPTQKATETAVPTSTPTETLEPTLVPKYPEGFSEEWEARFKMLSIAKGVDFSVTKNEEDKYQVYFVGDQTKLFMGTIETVENAEGEARDVLKITTAKNEPYRVDTDDLRAKEGGVQIVDPNGYFVPKGSVLLELTENGWEADHILYLAAGPNPYHMYNPNNPNNERPLDIEGNGLVTGVDMMRQNIVSTLATIVSENSIGLYDVEGVLHIYPIQIKEKIVFSCLNNSPTSQRCSICEVQELIDLLEEWNDTLIKRQKGYEFIVPPEEDGWGKFYESLISALKTGKDFPDNPQDHTLNVRGIKE